MPVFADESPQPPIIFTKATFEAAARPARDASRLQFEFGAIELQTPYAHVQFNYAMPTLPYVFPGRSWGEIPNAFVLTGMRIPDPPRH